MTIKKLIPRIEDARLHRKINVILLSGIISFSAIILYRFNPENTLIYPKSPFRELTGLYCPGCGTLRGLHQLLNGNFSAAFSKNPLMILALPYLVYSYICYCLPLFTRRQVHSPLIPSTWIQGFVKIVIAYWILRNIPIPPFSWLAP